VLTGPAFAGAILLLLAQAAAKTAASLGTMLAWPGLASLITGGFAGFFLAALYGTALLISGHATRKQQIPSAPFMIASAFLALLVGTL
jgi:leader peptidase (prepilin peptidase)/N-methyltransferase